MKKTVKIIALLIALVMVVGIGVSCNKTETKKEDDAKTGDAGSATFTLSGGKNIDDPNIPIKISVISISTAGITNQLYQMSLKEQAYRYPNVSFEFKDAEYDPTKQVTLIEDAITQGFDCIIIEGMDPVGLNEAIRKAEDAGIPVISNNAAEPTEPHTLHVAGADYSSGWKAGIELEKLAGGEGTAIVLDCPAEQKPGARMGTGFEEYVGRAGSKIKLLESISIKNWSTEEAQIAMSNMLAKYGPGQITMVYCASGDIASGALTAIDAAGRGGEGILIWGFMGYPMELDAIKEGRMAGTMFSDTYVQYAAVFNYAMFFIETGLTGAKLGFKETPIVEQPMFPTTAANVDDVYSVSRWIQAQENRTLIPKN